MEAILIPNSSSISKQYLEEKSNQIVSLVLEQGFFDSLEVYKLMTAYEKLFDSVKKALKSDVINEIEKYPKIDRKFGDVSFDVSSTGDRLNYEDYEPYRAKKQELKDLEARLKMAFKSKDIIVDPETGEELPKVSIKSTGSLTPKITIH